MYAAVRYAYHVLSLHLFFSLSFFSIEYMQRGRMHVLYSKHAMLCYMKKKEIYH